MSQVTGLKLLGEESIASPRISDHRVLSLTSLSLYHFRNYSSARIELSESPIILTGHNGAGKTNILEAVSLLAPGRGIRRAKLAEIDNRSDQGSWSVSAHVNGTQGQVQIGTGRDPESVDTDKRLVKIDGKFVRSQNELSRHMVILWLTPQTEQLFHESASAGRKFFDRLVYGFDPDHASRINEYEYAMRERNRLLQSTLTDTVWLDSLEQTMAETASSIASARLHAAHNINHAIAQSPLSFPKARIAMEGFAEYRLSGGVPAVQLEEELKQLWHAGRRGDAISGRTHVGAHKTALAVTHIEKDMPAQVCSTGEQKALLLSIVLAQARSTAAWKDIVPLLLLDEIAAHLDTVRRLELFQEVCQIGAQTWMSGTDANLFAELKGKAQYFQVENGHIHK